jgi:gluconolactonase
MGNEAIRPEFLRLIDEHAPLRQVGSGFTFTEGPIWHPRDHYLLFSDMPGDVRRRYDRAGVREVMRPSNKGNGMTYDRDLNLIVCACYLFGRALHAGGHAAGAGHPFRGQGAQQSE